MKTASRNILQDKSLLELQLKLVSENKKNAYEKPSETTENIKLYSRLRELEIERKEKNKQKSSSYIGRNLIYPISLILLLLLTSVTVLLVMQNTIELLIGIKALPLSSRVRF